jgi:DNA-binding SARP family transcriptional activator/TolB-like protein
MALMLQTFGRLCLRDRVGEDVAFPEKALVIICYLMATESHRAAKTTIAELLWGDGGRARSTVNLRKLVSRIRQRQSELGLSLLSISESEITLQGKLVKSDMADFTQVPATGASFKQLQRLAQRIHDGFLSGIQIESNIYDNWVNRMREAFVDTLRCGFEKAVHLHGVEDDPSSLKNIALLLLELRPVDEFVRNTLEMAGAASGLSLGNSHPVSTDNSLIILPASLQSKLSRSTAALNPEADSAARPELASVRERNILPPPRLVLLPPSLKGNFEENALSAALIEDITIALCTSTAVSVVAPYTSEQISLQADKASLFEKFSINYVLDTRLTQESGGHSIFSQLVHFGSDEVIWAERFDLRNKGLLTYRSEIASVISDAIGRQVLQNESYRQKIESDPAAYRAYLLGTRYTRTVSLPEVRRSRKLFREALTINAGMSVAMSSLARTYFMEWLLTARGDAELLRLAEDRAAQAIELDENSAFGHLEMGVIRLYRRDFDGSLEALDKAEALSPQFANLIASYADTLVQASRPEEALEKIKRAISLNPLCPDDYYWTAAGASYSLGDYQQSLDYIAKMKERAPADRLAAASWAMLGNVSKARQFVRKTLIDNPDFELDKWLLMVPFREEWQRARYREGLLKAGYQ